MVQATPLIRYTVFKKRHAQRNLPGKKHMILEEPVKDVNTLTHGESLIAQGTMLSRDSV